VYCIESPSGKRYVGISERPLAKRIKDHLKLSTGTRSNKAIHRAIQKYGKDQMVVYVLAEGVSGDDLYEAEKHFITELETLGVNGYNMTVGGEGTIGWFDNKSEDEKEAIRNRSSKVLSRIWADPEKRKHFVLGIQNRTKTHEFRDAARKRITELNTRPDFIKKRDSILRANYKSEKWQRNFDAAIKLRSENVEWKAAQRERIAKYYSNPNNRIIANEKLAIRNSDPDFQAKRLAGIQKVTSSLEWREKNAAKNKVQAKIKEHEYLQVFDLYKYGFNGKEIAKMFNVNSHQTIYNILKKLKL
jgi:group I intron endonuclease